MDNINNDDNSNNNQDTLINNNKVITLNNNNIINSSCNKVFNNIYIRRIIFNHLNKFNVLYPVNIEFESAEEFQQFKYKEYLHRVTLGFTNYQLELNQLPMNIKHITIREPKNIFKNYDEDYEIIQVPDHIESIKFIDSFGMSNIKSLSKQPHSSKINTLNLYNSDGILPNQIPNSITDLEIFSKRLSNNILPSNLKKLMITNIELLEDNCLQIESLTHLVIRASTRKPLIFDQLSITLILHQLSTPFFKNLVKLEFINENSIIDSNIQFPHNLKELIIKCKSFNYISQICFQFPLSLEILSILTYSGDVDNVYFKSLPPNLKSLKISCSSIIDDKGQSILPSKLKKLVICGSFNKVLQANQLPSTLTYLNLGFYYNQIIDVNVLPANLDTLILGGIYSQLINPLAIPQQLKLLEIINSGYSHPINLTPSTHPNTAISLNGDNINLYYQATSSDYNQIRVLRLPYEFNSPFSTLQLQNKSNLEYLHLGFYSNYEIELSDLPTENNIKTLVLSYYFNHIINLEYFQNLETLILDPNSNPTIITTTTTIIDDQQQYLHYNNYKLKNIIVSPKNVKHIKFLKQLDINFYQFIKYNNK